MNYYIAISDIHGEREMLDKALRDANAWIGAKLNSGEISSEDVVRFVFLGDYIDRGADSKYVLSKVKEYVLDREAIALIGNHDMFLIGTADGTGIFFEDAGREISNSDMWALNGGTKTCVQMYGVPFDTNGMTSFEVAQKIDVLNYVDIIKKSEEYDFLKNHGRLKYETEHIFFCHAQQSDPKNVTNSTLIWGRQKDYGKEDSAFKVPGDKKMSVHGHYHRLGQRINFPRIVNYEHGGLRKTVIMADSGCGCGTEGKLHPIILAEDVMRGKVEIVAIL